MPLVIDHHINNDCFFLKKGEAFKCLSVELNIDVPVSLSVIHNTPATAFHCFLLYSDKGKKCLEQVFTLVSTVS